MSLQYGELRPLAAEIGLLVWGTPANFNGLRFLAALLHGSSVRQPNFAALKRGRHLYSAERPSRWALAHISSCKFSAIAKKFKDSLTKVNYKYTNHV